MTIGENRETPSSTAFLNDEIELVALVDTRGECQIEDGLGSGGLYPIEDAKYSRRLSNLGDDEISPIAVEPVPRRPTSAAVRREGGGSHRHLA